MVRPPGEVGGGLSSISKATLPFRDREGIASDISSNSSYTRRGVGRRRHRDGMLSGVINWTSESASLGGVVPVTWRTNMSDDKSKPGGQDRKRISLTDDYEVRDWAKKFGVTTSELTTAVQRVGNDAADVEAHLKSTKK